jgi:hypothetical protein
LLLVLSIIVFLLVLFYRKKNKSFLIYLKRMKKKSVYDKLVDFNSDRDNPKLVSLVRQVLYDFSYNDLSLKYNDYEKVQKAIFNFFYFGKFSVDLSSKTVKALKEIISDYYISQPNDDLSKKKIDEINKKLKILPTWDDFYKTFHSNWKIIHEAHEVYLKKIKKPLNYIVVYEAPPYLKNEDIKQKYFLISDKEAYATTIKKCFGNDKNHVSDVLVKNNVGYFDLIMAQLPLSTSVRSLWGKHADWNIGGKQLPVVLLELGVAHLILKGKEFSNPIFAFGPPAKTSTAIFEYYSDKLFRVWKKKVSTGLKLEYVVFENPKVAGYELVLTSNLSQVNSPNSHKINGEKSRGEIFPLFKANVISGSNYLSEFLMKNAFDRL